MRPRNPPAKARVFTGLAEGINRGGSGAASPSTSLRAGLARQGTVLQAVEKLPLGAMPHDVFFCDTNCRAHASDKVTLRGSVEP